MRAKTIITTAASETIHTSPLSIPSKFWIVKSIPGDPVFVVAAKDVPTGSQAKATNNTTFILSANLNIFII